jgi:uroporphyrinogen-III synthase
MLLTSANAARHAREQLQAFVALPCYTVGEATAAAALAAGLVEVRTGPSDAEALLRMMADGGVARALHLCGKDRVDPPDGVAITRRVVYAAEAAGELPSQVEGALALVHSPRAAARFLALVDQAGLSRATVSIVAISESAAAAAGQGWKRKAVASRPREDALLELAAKLCPTEASEMGTGG